MRHFYSAWHSASGGRRASYLRGIALAVLAVKAENQPTRGAKAVSATGSVRAKSISDDSFGCEAPHSSGAYLSNAAQASVERTETVALAVKAENQPTHGAKALAEGQKRREADVCNDDAVTERTWSLSRPLCPDWRS